MRLMFQDEARFGRISDPRKCWAPAPLRPIVKLALVREYVYAYAAVSPQDGVIDWMLGGKMDTVSMGAFLRQVSHKHPEEFVMMVVDGAPSHRAEHLRVPKNMVLVKLPPYSPELNPVEHLWDELREKEFANRVFETLGAVIAQAARRLKKMEEHPDGLRSLTGWDWILKSI
nr:IS630 family transposase [Pelodictyon phaeoclathratiforme]